MKYCLVWLAIHSKNLVAILHLLVSLARHFRAPIRLPENVYINLMVVQVSICVRRDSILEYIIESKEIIITNVHCFRAWICKCFCFLQIRNWSSPIEVYGKLFFFMRYFTETRHCNLDMLHFLFALYMWRRCTWYDCFAY